LGRGGGKRDELAAPQLTELHSLPLASEWQHNRLPRIKSFAAVRDFYPANDGFGSQPANRIAALASGYVRSTDIITAKSPFEPIYGQLGIADGMLDILMTEIMLQRASIVAIVRKLVPAGVPEHVWVDWHLRGLAEAQDELVKAYGAHRPATAVSGAAGRSLRNCQVYGGWRRGLGCWKHRGNLPVLSSNWLTIARLLHSVQHFPLFLRSHFRELLLCAAGAPRWAVDPRLRQRRRQLFTPPVDAGAADAISSSVARGDPADGLMRAMTEFCPSTGGR
jgi:hypothetical protein